MRSETERSIFQSRLLAIWQRLMTLPMSQKWGETISSTSTQTWLSKIASHTPAQVYSMLASHRPPSIAQLRSLPWSDTTASGVFAWVLKPRTRSAHSNKECYVYIGSASKHRYGLKGRRSELLSKNFTSGDKSLNYSLREFRLNRQRSRFVTLLELPPRGDSDEEVRNIRQLVTLARGVFTI